MPNSVPTGTAARSSKVRQASSAEKKRRLSFKERAELESLPETIDALERERDGVYASMSDPAFLRDGAAVVAARARLDTIEAEVEARLARWEELETVAAQSR